MRDWITTLEFLKRYAGLEIVWRRDDVDGSLLIAVLVMFPGSRKVLLMERSYRPGMCYIPEPTETEVTTARDGDLWTLWNSDRAIVIGSDLQ